MSNTLDPVGFMVEVMQTRGDHLMGFQIYTHLN